jgi:hypothetical protein
MPAGPGWRSLLTAWQHDGATQAVFPYSGSEHSKDRAHEKHALLTVSNIFMTFAWYGHLKYKSTPLWRVILASWAIAFLEYCFQVPANRNRSRAILRRTTEDHAGSDHPCGVLRVLCFLFA